MHRKSKAFVTLAAVLVAVLVAGSLVGSESESTAQLDVEVSIAAVDSPDARYECTAIVTDLVSDKIVSAPKVTFRAGDDGARIVSGVHPGFKLGIVVSVNAEETEARYSAVVYRGDEVVSSQKVKVALGRS